MRMLFNRILCSLLLLSGCVKGDLPVEDMQAKAVIPSRAELLALEKISVSVAVVDPTVSHHKFSGYAPHSVAVIHATTIAGWFVLFAPLPFIGMAVASAAESAKGADLASRDRSEETIIRQAQPSYVVSDKLAEKLLAIVAASGLHGVYSQQQATDDCDGVLKVAVEQISINPYPESDNLGAIHMTASSQLSDTKSARILWSRSYTNHPTHPFPFESLDRDPAPFIQALDLELDALAHGLMRDIEYAR